MASDGGRKQEIVALAEGLFAERGYDAVSVRDLATAAGITVPTLYWYIGSKEQLLLELFRGLQQEAWERLSEVAAMDAPADEKLRAAFHVQFDLLTAHRSEALVTFRERHRVDPELRDEIQPTRREIDQIVRGILAEGEAQGLWRGVPLDVANLAFWSVVQYALQWFRPEGRKTSAELADEFADLLLHGLMRHSVN